MEDQTRKSKTFTLQTCSFQLQIKLTRAGQKRTYHEFEAPPSPADQRTFTSREPSTFPVPWAESVSDTASVSRLGFVSLQTTITQPTSLTNNLQVVPREEISKKQIGMNGQAKGKENIKGDDTNLSKIDRIKFEKSKLEMERLTRYNNDPNYRAAYDEMMERQKERIGKGSASTSEVLSFSISDDEDDHMGGT